MEDTVFHKILRKEFPAGAGLLYEDEHTYAFLDIYPNHPGHTLVIPKTPSRNILDITEPSWLAVMATVRKLAPAIMEAMHADGINIHMNNEPGGNQAVFYSHVHIIPRYLDDNFPTFPPGTYAEGEGDEVTSKILAVLNKKSA
jgi:histidine triad (HIT) family protein